MEKYIGKMHLDFKTTCIDVLQENKRDLFYTTRREGMGLKPGNVYILTFFVQSIPRCYKDTCIFLLFRRVYSYVNRILYTFVYDTLVQKRRRTRFSFHMILYIFQIANYKIVQ